MAGLKILEKMFPHSSPKKARKIKGTGVPVAIADGEFCISPEDLKARFGDLDIAHKIMDKWVMQLKEDHIKTLENLEPPVQD